MRSVAAVIVVGLGLGLGLAGCPRPHAPPWQVDRVGAAAIYVYPESPRAWAPDDRGAYVVTARADDVVAMRAALAREGADLDDVAAAGYVVRLDEAGRRRIAARADVATVALLEPAARRGPIADAPRVRARVDLFADASDAERDAVAAWLEARGARILARAPATLDIEAPRAVAILAARVGAVRWIEGR